MSTTRHDVMDEVLAHTDDLGFETGPGFSSHATMAAEALCALGYPEEAVPWTERYIDAVQYHPRPAPTARIDPQVEVDWRNARGDRRRLGDWVVFFEEELEEAPWTEVLALWWPRLVPGTAGGLTHGLIRTAHAVRTLATDPEPTSRMRRELAAGLAYWAAVYSPLPIQPNPDGARSAPEAIAALPPIDRRAILGARNRQPQTRDSAPASRSSLDDAVDELVAAEDVDRGLLALTSAFAGGLRARPASNPVAPVHTVTAPAAARMLLPYLAPEAQVQTYAYVWQSAAAVCAAFSQAAPAPASNDREPLPTDELRSRAVANGAAHAIKLTEACLREYQDNPDPVYLLAIEDVLPRMRRDAQDPTG